MNRQHWQEWQTEMLGRERTWEQKKERWNYFPIEAEEKSNIRWNLLGMAICFCSAGMVIGTLWAIFR